MIVDDDRDILELLCLVVEALGVSCEPFSSGEEAIERIRLEGFDLLILDKNLPGIDGIETARKARRIQPGVPIALVTGYFSEESTSEAVKVGINDYIRKPIDVDNFRQRLRELLPGGGGRSVPPTLDAPGH